MKKFSRRVQLMDLKSQKLALMLTLIMRLCQQLKKFTQIRNLVQKPSKESKLIFKEKVMVHNSMIALLSFWLWMLNIE